MRSNICSIVHAAGRTTTCARRRRATQLRRDRRRAGPALPGQALPARLALYLLRLRGDRVRGDRRAGLDRLLCIAARPGLRRVRAIRRSPSSPGCDRAACRPNATSTSSPSGCRRWRRTSPATGTDREPRGKPAGTRPGRGSSSCAAPSSARTRLERSRRSARTRSGAHRTAPSPM
jgi:hypothetical protein